ASIRASSSAAPKSSPGPASRKCRRLPRRGAPPRRKTTWDASSARCSAAPNCNGSKSSPKTAEFIPRRCWSAIAARRKRAAGATQASWGGVAQSAMGPFYCPADQKVYLDTSFFDQIATRFRGCDVGSRTCQFSQAYVIAHEVGHHVQNLLGILPKAQRAQRAA